MPNNPPKTIDLSKAQVVKLPQFPDVAPITGVQRAGVKLTYFVLTILSVFIVFIFCMVLRAENQFQRTVDELVQESSGAVEGAGGAADNQLATLKEIDQFRQNARTFVIDLTNIVVINALLPLITALLGYIFGTTASSNGSGESSG